MGMMHGRFAALIMAAAVTVLWSAVPAAAQNTAALDDAFLAAKEAARTGDSKKLDQLALRFHGHVLEPYVQYWRLKIRFEARESEEIRRYIHSNRDTPLSDNVRRDWLKTLGKNSQW